MIALLEWVPQGKGRRAAAMKEDVVLHLRVLRLALERGPRTPEAVLRRRVGKAARQLKKLGIAQVVLPPAFPYMEQLEKQGVRPVSTLALRRDIAAEWVRAALEASRISTGGARVAVCARQLTGEVVRTVTELALRHRYVLVSVPRGGEELSRQLRREYGVSLLLSPTREQLAEAEAAVLFDPAEDPGSRVTLRLYEEAVPLPGLSLPPALEAQLPADVDRGQLLATLRSAGVLKPGQICVTVA